MLRQYQTQFDKGKGNCWATCIACIIDAPVAEVPNFVAREYDWFKAAQEWCATHGWGIVQIPWPQTVYAGQFPKTLVVLNGWGPRSLRHSVVGRIFHDAEGFPSVSLEWDPHPDGGGLDAARGEQWLTFVFRLKAGKHPAERMG